MKKWGETIATPRQQIRRMARIVDHVQRLGPASREWVIARLSAVECSPRELRRLRIEGHR